MDKLERLRELVRQVPDNYPDFENGVPHFANKYGYVDQLIEYMETHPEATASEVDEYIDDLEDALGIPADDCDGISPLPDDE